jgi:peptidoglycan/LPS O-acetylase OafA/YrhL
MVKRIAAFTCCLSLLCGSIVSAQDATGQSVPVATGASLVSQPGPIQKAILSRHVAAMLAGGAGQATTAPHEDRRNWAERHPVWTGTLLGFAVGFGMTYAMAGKTDPNAFIQPVGPGGPALVFGGVGAGLGALAGWGFARNRDEDATAPPMPE